ncbi:MAG: hypothetical protein H6816_14010 [Phycisphaerales bacterium]|nr:hypothetical protein [Phycisphaerales bacterium]
MAMEYHHGRHMPPAGGPGSAANAAILDKRETVHAAELSAAVRECTLEGSVGYCAYSNSDNPVLPGELGRPVDD